MMILAIESTCDETSASIVQKQDEGVKVISNVVASSVDLAIKYGGGGARSGGTRTSS